MQLTCLSRFRKICLRALIVSAVMIYFSKSYSQKIDFRLLKKDGRLPLLGILAYIVLAVLPLLVMPTLMGAPLDFFGYVLSIG